MSSNIVLALNVALSLIVNVLTLGGFVFGIVELKPGWGPFSKPVPVVILLYMVMALSWLSVGFASLRWIKRRYGVGVGRVLNPTEHWKSTFDLFNYLFTVPTTVLWILAVVTIAEPSLEHPSGADWITFLIMAGGASLLGAGWAVSQIVLSIDWLLSPDDYAHQP